MPRGVRKPEPIEGEEEPMLPMATPRRQRDRQGKRTVAAHLDPEVARAVRILAVQSDRTMASLMTEAIEDVLSKYKHKID